MPTTHIRKRKVMTRFPNKYPGVLRRYEKWFKNCFWAHQEHYYITLLLCLQEFTFESFVPSSQQSTSAWRQDRRSQQKQQELQTEDRNKRSCVWIHNTLYSPRGQSVSAASIFVHLKPIFTLQHLVFTQASFVWHLDPNRMKPDFAFDCREPICAEHDDQLTLHALLCRKIQLPYTIMYGYTLESTLL